jgi:hypothetical protein
MSPAFGFHLQIVKKEENSLQNILTDEKIENKTTNY